MRKDRLGFGACAAAAAMVVAALGVRAPTAVASQTRLLTDGVFTEAQAERGANLYRHSCAECHQAAEFDGFLRGWVGLPVSFLYDSIRSQMPQDNPGGLSRSEYADVLTYVFEINGLPAGDDEMGSDAKTLEAITIVVADPAPRR